MLQTFCHSCLSDQELFLSLFQQHSQWDGFSWGRPRRSQGFTGVINTDIFVLSLKNKNKKNPKKYKKWIFRILLRASFHIGCDKTGIKEHLSLRYKSVSSILQWEGISFKKWNITLLFAPQPCISHLKHLLESETTVGFFDNCLGLSLSLGLSLIGS